MPLVHLIEDDNTRIAVWKLHEKPAYFLHKLSLSEDEVQEYNALNHRKAIEFLITRYLLHLIHPEHERIVIRKDGYGKPHLQDNSYHISLSHSNGYAAAILSKKNVGVDIQTYVDKIYRIKDRFINEQEKVEEDDIIHLHLIWGAKECIYKGYGKRSISLKDNITVQLKNGMPTQPFEGYLEIQSHRENYILDYFNNDKFMLVYAIQMD